MVHVSLSLFTVFFPSPSKLCLCRRWIVCLSVYLLTTLLKQLTDFDEIFGIAQQRYKEQWNKFCCISDHVICGLSADLADICVL